MASCQNPSPPAGMGSLRCLGSYNVDLNDWQQSMVLTGSSSGELGVYDTRTSRCVMTHQGHADAVLCITPHRAQVWTGGDDCAVCQWDMREARLQHTYTGMGNGPKVRLPVTAHRFGRQGRR